MSHGKRKSLGQILGEMNLILPEQLEAALERQQLSGRRLGQVLIDMGLITRDQVIAALLEQAGIPHVHLRKGLIDPKVVKILPRERAEAFCVIPMFKVENTLTLGMADATDIMIIDDVENLLNCRVYPVQCRGEDIREAINGYYSGNVEMDNFLESFKETDVQVTDVKTQDLTLVNEEAEGARVINLVNLIILNGIKEGASDIHVEPDVTCTRIRVRIDGILHEVMTPPAELHPSIVSRIKVMAKMDIAEKRVPQDGRIHVNAEGREIDVRISSMPTVMTVKIVMRLLDKQRLVLDVNRIGFHEETLADMKNLLRRPYGIILVTGPTGSGKTTTMYSGLTYLSSIEKNICTIEDPVEYQLPLTNQIQVSEEQGLTFVKTLRSLLRQDPDVIMVGEIRDSETARVSIQAAMTGHLVLATLHTNDSAGAIPRLVEQGIEPYLLSSAISGVVAQRLVRLVCGLCKTSYFPPLELLERIGWQGDNNAFVTGQGCERCFDSGLRNRTGIYELLNIDDEMRRIILKDPSINSIRDASARAGMRTLKDEAFRLVEEGRTSLEEIMRVVLIEDRTEKELVPSS